MAGGEIFIVDDDPAVRDAMGLLFTRAGYRVMAFADGSSFIATARERAPACVILDIYMPGQSGLDILKAIDAAKYAAPIFIASARGDIPTAIEGIRRGAVDFIDKCADTAGIVARVDRAVDAWRREQGSHSTDLRSRSFPGRESLTPREHDVIVRIVAGDSSQEAAQDLGISRRTVEVHRAHILAKLHARNVADLVRIVFS